MATEGQAGDPGAGNATGEPGAVGVVGVVSQFSARAYFFDALATVVFRWRVALGEREEAWRREILGDAGGVVVSMGGRLSLVFCGPEVDGFAEVEDNDVVEWEERLDVDLDDRLDVDLGDSGRRSLEEIDDNDGVRAGIGVGGCGCEGDNADEAASSRTTIRVRCRCFLRSRLET